VPSKKKVCPSPLQLACSASASPPSSATRGWPTEYLPPYSPDLNPIEEAFSKMKGISFVR
jgi:transposase